MLFHVGILCKSFNALLSGKLLFPVFHLSKLVPINWLFNLPQLCKKQIEYANLVFRSFIADLEHKLFHNCEVALL